MQKSLDKLMRAKAENILDTPKVIYSYLQKEQSFPLMISPRASGLILPEWIRNNKDDLEPKLATHGTILFRGFQIDSVEKFQHFVEVFEGTPLEYKQRSSPRFEVAKNIYHSTTYPADQSIHMHSENSYARNPPSRILFCCIVPADERGETPIADNRIVLAHLSASTRDKFLEKGVRYERNISKELGLSWQEIFQTDSRQEVEDECRNNDMQFEWRDGDRLTLSWQKPAIFRHPVTNEEVWFNHAFFFNKYALDEEVLAGFGSDGDLPFNTSYGDGTEIGRGEMEEIKKAYDSATILFPWETGDVLFLDNMLISHGRSPYKGDRRIIVSMF